MTKIVLSMKIRMSIVKLIPSHLSPYSYAEKLTNLKRILLKSSNHETSRLLRLLNGSILTVKYIWGGLDMYLDLISLDISFTIEVLLLFKLQKKGLF